MSTIDLKVLQLNQTKDAIIQGSLKTDNKYLLIYAS